MFPSLLGATYLTLLPFQPDRVGMQHFRAGTCMRCDHLPRNSVHSAGTNLQTRFYFGRKRSGSRHEKSILQGPLLSPEEEPVSSFLLSIALKFLMPSGKLLLSRAIFKLSYQLFSFNHWKLMLFILRGSNSHRL